MDTSDTAIVPAATPGALATGAATARILADASISANTRAAYSSALAGFDRTGAPETDAGIAACIGALYDAGRAASSAAMMVAALRFRARLDGRPLAHRAGRRTRPRRVPAPGPGPRPGSGPRNDGRRPRRHRRHRPTAAPVPERPRPSRAPPWRTAVGRSTSQSPGSPFTPGCAGRRSGRSGPPTWRRPPRFRAPCWSRSAGARRIRTGARPTCGW